MCRWRHAADCQLKAGLHALLYLAAHGAVMLLCAELLERCADAAACSCAPQRAASATAVLGQGCLAVAQQLLLPCRWHGKQRSWQPEQDVHLQGHRQRSPGARRQALRQPHAQAAAVLRAMCQGHIEDLQLQVQRQARALRRVCVCIATCQAHGSGQARAPAGLRQPRALR